MTAPCIVHYLRRLGYDLSRVEQTGSNFGTRGEAREPVPELRRQRHDGRRRAVDHQRRLLQHLVPRRRAPRSERATSSATASPTPPRGRTGDNCLLATKVMVPVDGEVREGVGLLGSPSFEIPRSVQRDSRFDHLQDRRGTAPPPGRQEPAQRRHDGPVPAGRGGCYVLRGHPARPRSPPSSTTAFGASGDRAGQRPGHPAVQRRATSCWSSGPSRGFQPAAARCSARSTTRDFWRHERFWKLPSETVRADLQRHAVQEPDLAAAGRPDRPRVFDDGCALDGEDPGHHRRRLHAQRAAASSSATRRRTAPSSPTAPRRRRLHPRGRRPRALRRDDRRGRRPRPRLLPDEGRERPAPTRAGAGTRPGRAAGPTAASGGENDDHAYDGRRGVLARPARRRRSSPRSRAGPDPAARHRRARAAVPDDLMARLGRLADETRRAAQRGAAGRARQGARRAVRRARGRHRLLPCAATAARVPCRLTTAPRSWRTLLRGHPPGRGRPAGAPALPAADDLGASWACRHRRSRPSSTRPDAAGAVDGHRAAGGGDAPRRPTTTAAALPDRRAGRGLRRPDRRLPPHRARPDRRRPGRRRTGSRACSPPRSSASSSTGSPDRAGSCPTAASTSCSSSGCGRTPTRVAAVHGDRRWTYRRAQRPRQPAGPRPAGTRAAPARASSRWSPSATWTGWPPSWRSSRPAACTCPSSRTSRPTASATMLARAGCALVLTEPGSTATLDQALAALPGVRTLFIDAASPRSHRDERPRRRRRRRTSSPTSTSPPAPPASPRARCASTRACSTTSTPRSTTWGSARGRSSPRPRPSASTSRCGSWSPRCWSAGAPCWSSRTRSSTSGGSSTPLADGAGRRAPGGAVLPRRRPVLPGAAPPRAAGPAVRLGHRRGAEEGTGPALVRGPARRSGWSTPTG